MKIKPDEMARIYWARMGKRSLREVSAILAQYQDAPNTQSYWIVVQAFLENCVRPGSRH